MFRKLFGWLNTPITSEETDSAFYLAAGLAGAFMAVMWAVTEHWWPAFAFALLAISQFRISWRHARDREPMSDSVPITERK
jgi:hypothetical protein